MFLVADGMGGHPEGDVAAEIAMRTFSNRFQREVKPLSNDPQEFLRLSVLVAHQQILRYSAQKGMLDAPRTTVVAAMVQKGMLYWAHVGDSRMYVARKGSLVTRTRDHSHIEAARAQNQPQVAIDAVNRNVLYSCLGSPQAPIMEVSGPLELEHGDTVLLCSDGLWGPLEDAVVVSTLSNKAVVDAVPELVEAALKVAGERADNTTALAFEWEGNQDFEETHGGISTMDVGEDSFASTIQASLLNEMDEADTLMDEDAIERTIAEIRDAIDKAGRTGKKVAGKR